MENIILDSATNAEANSEQREQPAGSQRAETAIRFLRTLGHALHRFGLPAHRLEAALTAVAKRLGVKGQFFATPTAIFASLESGSDERTVLIRLEPGEVNLAKLSELDDLVSDVTRGTRTAQAGIAAVERILDSPSRYGPWLVTPAFALASGCAARFFGGGLSEFLTSALIGLVTGVLAFAFGRRESTRQVFEPTAAALAGAIAVAASHWFGTSVVIATCGGLIVLIPGLTLTIGVTELATRNLASGTVRLTGALISFLAIGFGVALGVKVGGYAFAGGPVVAASGELPGWTLMVALLLAPASFTVLFQAPARDTGWITLAGVLAFAGARFGAHVLGPELGAFVGAFIVGGFSNLFARVFNRPASVTLVPGIMLLVPGSIGFQSLSLLAARDVISGVELAVTVGLVAVSLVTGLLVANAVVPPRRTF